MKAVLFLSALLLAANAFAGERYDFYNGVRQMGMGGASVATVNDETALILNPAALGKLRDYFITIIDPDLDVGVETQQMVGTDFAGPLNPQRALDKSNEYPNKHLHERAQVFPSIVVPNFGVGFFGKYSVDAQLDSTTNKFSYNYTNDYAVVIGANFRLWNGIIKLGTNARIVNRSEVHNDDIDPTRTDLSLSSLASSGVGVGTDTGLIITAPIAYLPTLAAVYRDVGRTSYAMRDGLMMNTTTKPDSTAPTLDGALSISPILGKRVRSTWTVQLDDTMNVNKEKDIMRRVHGGLEIGFADAVFIRGGMNQRYWTAGVELSMMNYQFQAATYGEDIGADQAPREDRRYEVKFAFRF